MSGFFFKSVVQLVLLFGAENWVVTPRIGQALGGVPVPGGEATVGGFPHRTLGGRREYILTGDVRVEAGFETMETYTR